LKREYSPLFANSNGSTHSIALLCERYASRLAGHNNITCSIIAARRFLKKY